MSKGIVTYSVGEEDYYLRMPNGRIERIDGFWRFVFVAGSLILRGYTLRETPR